MGISEIETASRAALRAEALGWLRRLNSGEATTADVEALDRWRACSPAHAAEFAEAALFWDVLGDAARKAECRRIVPASARGVTRRGLLAGGAALAASATCALALRPPLELWPSVPELAADYRTRTGERRQIEIENFAAVELNTRTSVDLQPPREGSVRIELIAGEAVVSTHDRADREAVVIAGNGRVISRGAAFNIRKEGALVSVTCVAGAVDVSCGDTTVGIPAGRQGGYDAYGPREVVPVDADAVTAWRRGLLVFRRAPLSDVIKEVNRYRSGRLILVNAAIGRRQVFANFRLDRIDEVVDFISNAMDIPIRSLPGSVVLVG